MDSDKAFLPWFLHESIYVVKENIKQPEQPEAPSNQESGLAGTFSQQTFCDTLILIRKPGEERHQEAMELLQKIIKAVNLPEDQIKVLNQKSTQTLAPDSLQEEYNFKHLWIMGIDPTEVTGKSDKYYQINNTQEGFSFFFADSLESLLQDSSKKRALWQILKQLYNF